MTTFELSCEDRPTWDRMAGRYVCHVSGNAEGSCLAMLNWGRNGSHHQGGVSAGSYSPNCASCSLNSCCNLLLITLQREVNEKLI